MTTEKYGGTTLPPFVNATEHPAAVEDTTTMQQESLVPYPVINTEDTKPQHGFEIRDLRDINTNTVIGRLFMAALAKLTTESQRDKTPWEVIEQCNELAAQMYPNHKVLLHSLQ